MVNIGKRLKKIRRAKGLTQGDVRKATGLFQCHLARIENDYHDPSLATLEKIARAFSMEFCDLLYQITCSRFKAEIPEMDDIAVAEPASTAIQTPLQISTSLETQTGLQTP
jgi:transcriptional regulator with XRE-family HTH domain